MVDLVDEVVNDHKQEKRVLFFYKIFPYIVSITIVVAVLMGFYNYQSNKREEFNQKNSDLLLDLISKNNINTEEDSNNLLNLIRKNGTNNQELADIYAFSVLNKEKPLTDIIGSIEKVIDNKNYSTFTHSYSRLFLISKILDQKKLTPELEKKLVDNFSYFKEKKQLFFANATLLKVLYYKKKKNSKSMQAYANLLLKDNNTPPLIKNYVEAILFKI